MRKLNWLFYSILTAIAIWFNCESLYYHNSTGRDLSLAPIGAIVLVFIITHKWSIGTKSVICGAHCFFLHPWFVALAWWKLYGFPWDPRLWFAFWLHDLG